MADTACKKTDLKILAISLLTSYDNVGRGGICLLLEHDGVWGKSMEFQRQWL